ncbi:MAG: DUF3341 domain-containing protein [Gammaproteobacteria bacterium]|nr:DUF3341 domain-containing protein [Gammaproteobacteria bacterium]
MKKNHRMLASFKDFDYAFDAIKDIRSERVAGVSIDDVTLNSPIEHPEIDEVLGNRPVYIARFAFFGAVFGMVFGFIFLASAQAGFLVQPVGGKPVIPLISNIVLIYEMFIFFAVWSIFFGFMLMSGLFKNSMLVLFNRNKELYNEASSVDEVVVIVETDELLLSHLKALFEEHSAVDVKWEKIA